MVADVCDLFGSCAKILNLVHTMPYLFSSCVIFWLAGHSEEVVVEFSQFVLDFSDVVVGGGTVEVEQVGNDIVEADGGKFSCGGLLLVGGH